MKTGNHLISRRTLLQGLCAGAVTGLLTRLGAETTGTATEETAPADTHRVLCANILLASPAHEGKPEAWANRRDFCIDVVQKQNADIICLQEVLHEQVVDFQKAMTGYFSFGFAGPEMDAHPTGYHGITKNVILYSDKRYEITSAGGFWLSETPLIAGSVSWDALRGRHANWVRLKDRSTGKEFRVIDTHFDHKGKEARVHQAEMINKDAQQYAEDFPQVLAGDFNADINNPAIKTILSAGWTDTYAAVHGTTEPGNTFHALKGPDHKTKTGKIDFIFCRGNVKPIAAEIIKDHNNGVFPSDHYFVTADVKLT